MAADARYVIKADDKTKGAVKSANKGLKSISNSILGLAGAYAALRGVSNIIDTHRRFGAAIADLKAITGATGKDMAFLTAKTREYGATTTLTGSQVAEAFKLVASAKPDLLDNVEALSKVTKETITLAEASGSTLPDAARTLGSALNQFGADAEEAGRFINVLAAGAKFGASEIADTALALKDSGLVAASAGTSFEELNAAIQAMSTVSLKGAEAGVGLRNVYLNLTKQTNEQFKPAVAGLTQAILNIKDAQLSEIELLDIFGKKNIVAIKALIKQSDVLSDLKGKLTGTTTAYEQASIKVNTLDGDIKKMDSAWEDVVLTIGDEFNPALRDATQLLADLAKPVKFAISLVGGLGDVLGANAAILMAIKDLNIEAVGVIIDELTSELSVRAIYREKLWEEKNAQDELNNSKKESIELAKEAGAINKIELKTTTIKGFDTSKIDALRLSHASELDLIRIRLQTENDIVNEWADAIGASEAERMALLEQNEAAHQSRRTQILRSEIDQRMAAEDRASREQLARDQQNAQMRFSVAQGIAGNLAVLMQSGSKKEFEIGKKASLASAVIKGYEAITSSYAAGAKVGGPYLGAAYAAVAAIATKVQIDRIRSQTFGGGSSLGGAPGGGTPTIPNTSTQAAPQPIQQSGQPQEQIIRLILNIRGGASDEFADMIIRNLEIATDTDRVVLTDVTGGRINVNTAVSF